MHLIFSVFSDTFSISGRFIRNQKHTVSTCLRRSGYRKNGSSSSPTETVTNVSLNALGMWTPCSSAIWYWNAGCLSTSAVITGWWTKASEEFFMILDDDDDDDNHDHCWFGGPDRIHWHRNALLIRVRCDTSGSRNEAVNAFSGSLRPSTFRNAYSLANYRR